MSATTTKLGKGASILLWILGAVSLIFPEQMPLADLFTIVCLVTLEVHFVEALFFMLSKRFSDEDRNAVNLISIMAFGLFQLLPLMHRTQQVDTGA